MCISEGFDAAEHVHLGYIPRLSETLVPRVGFTAKRFMCRFAVYIGPFAKEILNTSLKGISGDISGN